MNDLDLFPSIEQRSYPRKDDAGRAQERQNQARDPEPFGLDCVVHGPEDNRDKRDGDHLAERGFDQAKEPGNKPIHWDELTVDDPLCIIVTTISLNINFISCFFVSLGAAFLIVGLIVRFGSRHRRSWRTGTWPQDFLQPSKSSAFTRLRDARLLMAFIGLALTLMSHGKPAVFDGVTLMATLTGTFCGINLAEVGFRYYVARKVAS